MRLIRKKTPHPAVRELGEDEVASVRRFCSSGGHTEPHDAAVVAAILNEMRDGRDPQCWLECDCRDTEVSGSRQPRLTARVREQGPPHFVRLNRYGAHTCSLHSFRTDPDEDEDDDPSPEPGKHRPLRPVNDTLDYLDDEREPGAGKPTGGPTGPRGVTASGERLPRLGRILHTILNDAGFNAATAASGQPPWDRVSTFADGEELTDTLSLRQVLFTEPWTRLAEKMNEIDGLQWPAGKKRSALLLFVADRIEAGSAIKFTRYKPATVTPERGMRIGGRDQKHSHPPYWVLAVIDRNRKGEARVREAFAQHAYSSAQPVPLDSHYERRTLAQLLKIVEWVGKRGVAVTLVKPLFDSDVTLASGEVVCCRPDFELEFNEITQGTATARRHRIVVETMGSESEDYLIQKARTHEIMRSRGVLLEHVVLEDSEQDARDEAFRKRLYGRILQLAGVPRQAVETAPQA